VVSGGVVSGVVVVEHVAVLLLVRSTWPHIAFGSLSGSVPGLTHTGSNRIHKSTDGPQGGDSDSTWAHPDSTVCS
jgi:hypothetical protein